MRASRLEQFGDPSVLGLADVPEPTPSVDEVLIDVDAAGVNYGDVLVRRGEYMGRAALPVVPGWEVVGRRVDAGTRVVCLLAGGGYAERVVAPARSAPTRPCAATRTGESSASACVPRAATVAARIS